VRSYVVIMFYGRILDVEGVRVAKLRDYVKLIDFDSSVLGMVQ